MNRRLREYEGQLRDRRFGETDTAVFALNMSDTTTKLAGRQNTLEVSGYLVAGRALRQMDEAITEVVTNHVIAA